MDDNLCDLGHMLSIATVEVYMKILDKFGKKLTSKFMNDASQEEKDNFVKRIKHSQEQLLYDRLSLIMNRILADYHFIKAHNEMMASCKSIEELRQDNEIANNHLQSIENERFILQRDTDMAIDKLESVCEAILEHKVQVSKK